MKAISIFDKVLKEEPTYPEALIGRGTAYASQRELENAIADFTKLVRPGRGEDRLVLLLGNLLWFQVFSASLLSLIRAKRLAALEKRINMLSQNRGGAGCSTSTSSETSTGYASLEDRSSGRSLCCLGKKFIPLLSDGDKFQSLVTQLCGALCNVYCRDAILRMTYYWYNFMPLARGTAVTGFVVLLGLLLAANMEFTESIPKGLQMYWEAILNVEPGSFVGSVKSWLYPSLKINTSWRDRPEVSSAFSTTRSVVAALSTCND
ncbi:hypothetical protein IGI04_013949 [Brassica rapa subsp. trilocularis]|uniref:Uncharacterized protein n=1 Tax=Brassica rapa subsp. trilocularis TaxID=1813537 RepID=A0ABQ7NCN3_BRACM|nr:hypothetical protein IGI04_013949 [Brassica rapa subsp. trilocularis]